MFFKKSSFMAIAASLFISSNHLFAIALLDSHVISGGQNLSFSIKKNIPERGATRQLPDYTYSLATTLSEGGSKVFEFNKFEDGKIEETCIKMIFMAKAQKLNLALKYYSWGGFTPSESAQIIVAGCSFI